MDKEKTGLLVTGIVWQVNRSVSKDNKDYYSVDLLVKGLMGPLKVKLPDGYDRAALQDGALVRLPLSMYPNYFKPGTFDFKILI